MIRVPVLLALAAFPSFVALASGRYIPPPPRFKQTKVAIKEAAPVKNVSQPPTTPPTKIKTRNK